MTFKEVLQRFRTESFTEREKGAKFEKLIKKWFQTDPRYADKLQEVWLWEEFPGKKDFGGKDLGIDLVAKTDLGDYWAIQCKCYDEKAVISKAVVDSFISTAHRAFIDDLTLKTTYFSNLIWVSTTLRWGANAEETLKGQDIPVTRINMHELEASPVDWDKLLKGDTGKAALREGKQPRKHQLEAMKAAHEYFRVHDRGKLIMACGTGKTYTSLEIIEQETGGKGLILFMVPSIALLGQSLNAWMTDTKYRMKAVCICSDSKASKRNDFDNDETSIIDNPLPATTNINSIKRQLLGYKDTDGLVVVFSTYQSIDVLAEAQRALLEADPSYGIFDYIVCDEAHRTTGFKQKGRDESHFTKIHNNDLIRGKKRLYMTATPRYYNDNHLGRLHLIQMYLIDRSVKLIVVGTQGIQDFPDHGKTLVILHRLLRLHIRRNDYRDNDITIFLLIRSPLVERTHHTPHALHDIHLAITGGYKKNSVQSRHIHPFGQATHVR